MRLIALVSLLAVAACDTSGAARLDIDTAKLSQDPAALVGTWDLVSITTSGFSFPAQTFPVSRSGSSETLVFRDDGSARVQRDSTAEETTYEVVTYPFEYAEGRFRQAAYLRIGEFRKESFGIDGDRLYFDDRPKDGDLREYRRRAAGGG